MSDRRRRSRSRSPNKRHKGGDRNGNGRINTLDMKGNLQQPNNPNMFMQPPNMQNMNSMMINPMMQGGMMMPMYPNMMMQGMMPGNMMQQPNMDGSQSQAMAMIPANMMQQPNMDGSQNSGMEIMPQPMSQAMPQNIQQSMQPMPQQQMPQPHMDHNMPPGQPPLPPPPMPPVDMSLMAPMMMDASMMGMNYPMGMDMPMEEKKEIILKSCKLTPPAIGAILPARRPRPPGCRTIFVGGLPDRIKESTVRDIFERYGRIYTLRLSKKNFCHIRFERESCVDQAMALSGYRLKLTDVKEDEDETHANSGWLHVDFALSRDDQKEDERRQYKMLQAMQSASQQNMPLQHHGHRSRRSPSPPRIQPYSQTAMVQLAEQIKSEERFTAALPTLVVWLERGECSKKNANTFYSMIQATNGQIRRLFNEKMQCEEELQTVKDRIKESILNIINQIEQVGKVLSAATHQRVWDHFTKPQRKNIETWQKMSQEFAALKDEFKERFEDEDEDGHFGNNFMDQQKQSTEISQLQRENEDLKFQLEAYKNEVDVIKSESSREMEKFKAQFIARQALYNHRDMPNPPPPDVKPPPPPPTPLVVDDKKVQLSSTVDEKSGEAKLIGVMAAFLQVHPQGASLDYVVSYVRALFPSVNQATVHHVLQKHTEVFQRTTKGVGANIEHRWDFIAFKDASS